MPSSIEKRPRRSLRLRPAGEPLEARALLASAVNPIGSPRFQDAFTNLLASAKVPQGSIALMTQGQVYTAGATNASYFSSTHTKAPAPITPASIFRLASLSKPFVGAAIMELVQMGKISLDDSAFTVLGFHPGQTITGNDPLKPSRKVQAELPSQLFDITIGNLLQMQSGLPSTIPVTSTTFPKAKDGSVYQTQGSYASLIFAGKPPYKAPATEDQQINYFLYQVAKDPTSLSTPGQAYVYQDFNFHLAAQIVTDVAGKMEPGLDYRGFLQKDVLGPMGISTPTQPPVANDAMVGGANTLEKQAYPTEVKYYMPNPKTGKAFSIIPRKTASEPPFYPPTKVPIPYGGSTYQHGSALAATPTALVTFMNSLVDAYEGQGTGPLNRQSVRKLIQEPEGGPDVGKDGWFALGLQIFPDPSDPDDLSRAVWSKGGDEPGSLTSLKRFPDGSIIAQTYNLQATGSNLPGDVDTLIQQYTFGASGLSIVKGDQQGTPDGQSFATPLEVNVTDILGGPARGAYATNGSPPNSLFVTFTAPQGGAGATFSGGRTSVQVKVDEQGNAIAPTLTANDQPGTFQVVATITNPGTDQPYSQTFSLTNTNTPA